MIEADTGLATVCAQFVVHVCCYLIVRPHSHRRSCPCPVTPYLTDGLRSDAILLGQARCIMSALAINLDLVDCPRIVVGEYMACRWLPTFTTGGLSSRFCF